MRSILQRSRRSEPDIVTFYRLRCCFFCYWQFYFLASLGVQDYRKHSHPPVKLNRVIIIPQLRDFANCCLRFYRKNL